MSLKVANIINMITIAKPIRKPTSWALSDKRASAHCLNRIEQKVSAIEQRNRKQI